MYIQLGKSLSSYNKLIFNKKLLKNLQWEDLGQFIYLILVMLGKIKELCKY